MEPNASKIRVTHFQRRKHPYGSYSVEFIFSDIRERLKSKVDFRLKIASRLSTGFINRLINTVEAILAQSSVNHVTGDIHYVTFFLKKKKTILTILDCVFLTQCTGIKRRIYKFIWLTLPVRRARFITAISTATKEEILRNTKTRPDKIFVIPIGVSDVFQPHPRAFNNDLPVLLHVGTSPNKNLTRLVEAINGLKCHLIVIGKLSEADIANLERYRISYENRVNLNATQMLEEYKKCDLLTFVSTYEGFGMPIIEANFVERPVVAGRNSSMIEVSGDAACLVDAYSVADIRAGIIKVIADRDYRERLIRNGRRNRVRFDPQVIAEQYYNLYEIVGKSK